MVKLVGICVVLFVLALGTVIASQGHDLAALFNGFQAEPLLGKIAWLVVVLVPLVLLPSVVWLSDTLVRQRKAAHALELRLDGVRRDVKDLAKTQIDADAALHHLARTDPEYAMGSIQQRLGEAERVAEVQSSRNEIGDLQSRVDEIRNRQQNLKERLAPVLDKRRTIERLFIELDTGQNDIERALTEIVNGDDAVALDLRLNELGKFLSLTHVRCDEIEQASKTLAGLKEVFTELEARLAPFAAADGGVTSRIRELGAARDKLARDIESVQQSPQGSLDARLQSFADDKKKLDDGIAHLNGEFSKLVTLRKEIDGFSANFERALEIFAVPAGKGKGGVDARIEDLSKFITRTQDHFTDVESKMVTFGQLRAKLGELQSRIAPLEAVDGGVVNLVQQVQDAHDRLLAQIARLEQGDNGDLAGRVKVFADAKRELEQRVSVVTDQFSQLATIRKDISGLFDKLSSAVNGPTNGA